MASSILPIYSIDSESLALVFPGIRAYRIRQILEWVYKKRIVSPSLMTSLPQELRQALLEKTSSDFPRIKETCITSDETEKSLIELRDHNCIESVIIKAPERITFCLSSQVGCPVKCLFCSSGMPDFIRNLSPDEITGQFMLLSDRIGRLPDNLVFMGIGGSRERR